jgi:hypothetical protein
MTSIDGNMERLELFRKGGTQSASARRNYDDHINQ